MAGGSFNVYVIIDEGKRSARRIHVPVPNQAQRYTLEDFYSKITEMVGRSVFTSESEVNAQTIEEDIQEYKEDHDLDDSNIIPYLKDLEDETVWIDLVGKEEIDAASALIRTRGDVKAAAQKRFFASTPPPPIKHT
jgi:hypothetical protein